MNISDHNHQVLKEAPLPTAQRKTRNVSAAVVDTSGLSHPLLAAAARVDDDAQSLVIAAPAAPATSEHETENHNHSTSSSNTLSPSSGHNNNNNTNNAPTHIPVVEENVASSSSPINKSIAKSEKGVMNVDSDEVNEVMDNTKSVGVDNEEEDMSDDESEYEYEDDDDAAFSGFLMTNNTYGTTTNNANNNSASSSSAPARIVEEETVAVASSATASASATSAAAVDGDTEGAAPRKKWREPSRAAVSMSLRAQQETSGSKRRLAQDLYRIMNQDHEEAGFSLAPQSEDSMEKWTIKLFQFDPDSNLAKDMLVVGIDHIELEMEFPEQYPFEPPFVRVSKPRFKRQTGFVMNGALCMELLTKDGWNPINDIESVIVSVRSLLVVGDGRVQAATDLTKARYDTLLATAQQEKLNTEENGEPEPKKARRSEDEKKQSAIPKSQVGSYTATEAQSAYSHLSDYHKKKGWDTSGWWARKG
jgi:ubiquitin-conjugating enzyme E2 Q